jgi:hypothetical protein
LVWKRNSMSAMSGFKRPEPVEGESDKWTIQKLLAREGWNIWWKKISSQRHEW